MSARELGRGREVADLEERVRYLRFPKVYGPGSPDGLSTFYAFREAFLLELDTRGNADHVAAAVVLAVTRAEAAGKLYNPRPHRGSELRYWKVRPSRIHW